MKYLKTFKILKEEIDWTKNPWKFIKNLRNLEEEEEEEEEEEDEVKNVESPNDIVTIKTGFQLSLFRLDLPSQVIKSIEILMKRNNLSGSCFHKGQNDFFIEAKGKRYETDKFYYELKKLIKG